jgi:hypothetical protein
MHNGALKNALLHLSTFLFTFAVSSFMMAFQVSNHVGAVTLYRLLKALPTHCLSLRLIQFLYISIIKYQHL